MSTPLLLVEDDAGIIGAMKLILTTEGYDVVVVSDGALVLDEVARRRPALILLDLWIPNISGDRVCSLLKANKKTASIPVLIVSANHAAPRIAKECGADAFLSKPFEMATLLKKIRALLYT